MHKEKSYLLTLNSAELALQRFKLSEWNVMCISLPLYDAIITESNYPTVYTLLQTVVILIPVTING